MRHGQYVINPTELLRLKSNGLTDREIADHCSIHIHTVRNRIKKQYTDMGAINGYHAVALGISQGLIPPVTWGVITDCFGGAWELCKPGCKLQIIRPGKVQCDCLQ